MRSDLFSTKFKDSENELALNSNAVNLKVLFDDPNHELIGFICFIKKKQKILNALTCKVQYFMTSGTVEDSDVYNGEDSGVTSLVRS